MANFVFRRTKDGSAPITMYLPKDARPVTKGELVGISTSGYVQGVAGGSITTTTVLGVAEETVAAGLADIAVQVNRSAIYGINTLAAAVQADVGTHVAIHALGCISESNSKTDSSGVVKIEKLLSTTGTANVVEGSINFACIA